MVLPVVSLDTRHIFNVPICLLKECFLCRFIHSVHRYLHSADRGPDTVLGNTRRLWSLLFAHGGFIKYGGETDTVPSSHELCCCMDYCEPRKKGWKVKNEMKEFYLGQKCWLPRPTVASKNVCWGLTGCRVIFKGKKLQMGRWWMQVWLWWQQQGALYGGGQLKSMMGQEMILESFWGQQGVNVMMSREKEWV